MTVRAAFISKHLPRSLLYRISISIIIFLFLFSCRSSLQTPEGWLNGNTYRLAVKGTWDRKSQELKTGPDKREDARADALLHILPAFRGSIRSAYLSGRQTSPAESENIFQGLKVTYVEVSEHYDDKDDVLLVVDVSAPRLKRVLEKHLSVLP